MKAKLSAVELDPPIAAKVASSLVWEQSRSTKKRAIIDAFGVKKYIVARDRDLRMDLKHGVTSGHSDGTRK